MSKRNKKTGRRRTHLGAAPGQKASPNLYNGAGLKTPASEQGALILRPLLPPEIGGAPGGAGFKLSGHAADQMLKVQRDPQLSLLELLYPETQERIISTGASLEWVNRRGVGIKLSKGEDRLLLSFAKLLHVKSENFNREDASYYMGNRGFEVINWQTPEGKLEVRAPKIGFTLFEIAKEYRGGKAPSGRDMRIVADLLYGLAENPDKKALLIYRRVEQIGKTQREYFIERFDSLIHVAEGGYKDWQDGKLIDEHREIIVILHPIFADQIADKYIKLPLDINKRLIESYGSPNIPEMVYQLTVYLSRALSNIPKNDKVCRAEIGLNKLYSIIAKDYVEQSRYTLIEKYYERALETIKRMGLLLKYETRPGAKGDIVAVFYLNREWLELRT